jgi:hypothetical protein
MSDFVGDNPVMMSGSLITRRNEQIVVGDGQGNTLTFRWIDGESGRGHGSPSAILIELPSGAKTRHASSFIVHAEGKYAQVRYTVEPVGEDLRLVSYTVIEDIGALLSESEAPGLINHAPEDGTRLSVGTN